MQPRDIECARSRRHGQRQLNSTHGGTQPIVGQVDLQAEVDVEQRLGELLDSSRVCKVQLVLRPETEEAGVRSALDAEAGQEEGGEH